MSKIVILPSYLEKILDELCLFVQKELCGVLFYIPDQKTCPLDTFLITGIGTEDRFSSDKDRVAVVNTFLQQNPEYKFVHFHTHPRGTMSRLGEYAATHFSQADITDNNVQADQDPEYIALLVTPFPQQKPIWGRDNPTLARVGEIDGRTQRSRYINAQLKQIAQQKGIDLKHNLN